MNTVDSFKSKRLLLRPLEKKDLDKLVRLFANLETMNWFPFINTREEAEEWLRINQESYKKYGYGMWAVTRRSDGKFLGQCGLLEMDIDGQPYTHLTFHIINSERNRGYATESATICRDYAFYVLAKEKIVSLLNPDNYASLRVAEKVGMQLEKELVWKGREAILFYVPRTYLINTFDSIL